MGEDIELIDYCEKGYYADGTQTTLNIIWKNIFLFFHGIKFLKNL